MLLILSPAALLCFAPQAPLEVFDSAGAHAGARAGWSVAGLSDVDQDGYADVALGAPFDGTVIPQGGSVSVRSGRDGHLLSDMYGSSALDHFGWSLANAGDVDHDGYDDWIAGAPDAAGFGQSTGAASLVSGRTGAGLRTFNGWAIGIQLGYAVAGAGDVDGDGAGDVLIGAWLDDSMAPNAGATMLASGATGTTLRWFYGATPDQRSGVALAGLGDIDHDGRPDVAVGCDPLSGPGVLRVYSGASGAPLLTLNGATAGDRFGFAICGAGDVNGDGTPDFAVGAPGEPGGGAVHLVSGASGANLYTLHASAAGESFGFALAALGDLDGDASIEFAASALFDGGAANASGRVRVYSAPTGALHASVGGQSGGDRFGWSLSAAGDVNGDGRRDYVVGAPKDDAGGVDSGRAAAFSGSGFGPRVYCTAKVNSQGCLPRIGSSGEPALSGPDAFFVTAEQVLNQKNGVFFHGVAPAAFPYLGGTLCVAPPIKRTPVVNSGGNPPPANCTGLYSWHLSQAYMQSKGWSAGTTIYGQFWSRDPAHADGSTAGLTDAIEIRIGP